MPEDLTIVKEVRHSVELAYQELADKLQGPAFLGGLPKTPNHCYLSGGIEGDSTLLLVLSLVAILVGIAGFFVARWMAKRGH